MNLNNFYVLVDTEKKITIDKIQTLPLAQLKYGFENGFLHAGTPYFNNLVATKHELLNNWITPVNDSWLSAKIPAKVGSVNK